MLGRTETRTLFVKSQENMRAAADRPGWNTGARVLTGYDITSILKVG